jgi:sec-independent protein translocase protein TatA
MGFGSFGMGEMVFIFLIVLLLFGAKRLPEIGSSLGKGIREFKSSMKDIQNELQVPEDRPQIHRTNAPPPESTAKSDGEPRKLSDGVASTAEEQR